MTLVLLTAVLCFAAAGVSLLRTVSSRRAIRASLDRVAGVTLEAPTLDLPSLDGRRLPLAHSLASLALTARPGAKRDEIALRLAGAGVAQRLSVDAFLAFQGLGLVVSAGLGILVAAGGSPTTGIVLALAGIGTSIVVPDRLLASRAARRGRAVLAELPGALDLLCVSVEAGLGFDAALARVADAIRGPLGDEFRTMLSEIRVGEARMVALQRLADRIGVADVTTFVRSVTRAEQLGTSLAQTLRVQAADARARRQLAAEEAAGKAPVKMLFPTIVFIFPALFVVVLGPALLTFKGFLG